MTEIKVTNKSLSFILAILTIISIISSVVIAANVTAHDVEENKKDIEKIQVEAKDCKDILNNHEVYIQVLNSKLDDIGTDIKEIKQGIKVINTGRLK